MQAAPDHSSTSHVHVSPMPMFYAIFGALMLGTFLTVWAAYQDFGAFDTPLALLIAITKAVLVVLFFMHVKYASKIVMLSAASGFMFLVFLLSFTLVDVQRRAPVAGWPDSVDLRDPLEAGLVNVDAPPKPKMEDMDLVAQGEYHFNNTYVCNSCHSLEGERKVGPALNGRWGTMAQLESGSSETFDDAYFKESVYQSREKIAKGYPPAMPVFAGVMKDEDYEAIKAYVKTFQ